METVKGREMPIPVGAEVRCADGVCGRIQYVLIDPVAERVTHMVVQEGSSPHREYIVPVRLVSAATPDAVALTCTKEDLAKLDPFVKTEFVKQREAEIVAPLGGASSGSWGYGPGTFLVFPYVTADKTVRVPVPQMQIPPGELAVRRGARVEATDGYVGRVDEFLINPDNGHITHLVMREGHLWGQKDVFIPVSAILETRERTVVLNLDRHQIGALPAIPLRESHRRLAAGTES